eukprot:66732-Rhodomonas_salina.2
MQSSQAVYPGSASLLSSPWHGTTVCIPGYPVPGYPGTPGRTRKTSCPHLKSERLSVPSPPTAQAKRLNTRVPGPGIPITSKQQQ